MGEVDLLEAVANGEVRQTKAGIGRRYQHNNGVEIAYMELAWLKRKSWIELPLGGDPWITEDGRKWLNQQPK